MKDTELDGERERRKFTPRKCWIDGVRRSMKRKGLREKDTMNGDF